MAQKYQWPRSHILMSYYYDVISWGKCWTVDCKKYNRFLTKYKLPNLPVIVKLDQEELLIAKLIIKHFIRYNRRKHGLRGYRKFISNNKHFKRWRRYVTIIYIIVFYIFINY